MARLLLQIFLIGRQSSEALHPRDRSTARSDVACACMYVCVEERARRLVILNHAIVLWDGEVRGWLGFLDGCYGALNEMVRMGNGDLLVGDGIEV